MRCPQVTVTKDDWLLIAGKRKRGDEIIAFSERFKLPPNVDLTGALASFMTQLYAELYCLAYCLVTTRAL